MGCETLNDVRLGQTLGQVPGHLMARAAELKGNAQNFWLAMRGFPHAMVARPDIDRAAVLQGPAKRFHLPALCRPMDIHVHEATSECSSSPTRRPIGTQRRSTRSHFPAPIAARHVSADSG